MARVYIAPFTKMRCDKLPKAHPFDFLEHNRGTNIKVENREKTYGNNKVTNFA